jgi:RNA polymerase sigma-70 factor (ECF subfamily)
VNEQAPDEDLVRLAAGGNRDAFGTLVERHGSNIYHLCLRIMGNPEDAHDAAQDTFLVAMRKLDQFRGDAAFSTWLHRVGVNACYDALRRKKRRPMLRAVDPDDGAAADLGPVEDDRADEIVGTMGVAQALAEIAEDYRVAVVLADVQDMAYDDIAKVLDVPVGTVKSRVHRGRLALANVLGLEPGARRASRAGEPAGEPGASEGQS